MSLNLKIKISGIIYFLFFNTGTELRAQVNLGDVKRIIIGQVDKSVPRISAKEILTIKPFLDSLHAKLKSGDTLTLPFNLKDNQSQVTFRGKDTLNFAAIGILIPQKNMVEYAYPFEKGDTMQLYIKHKSWFNLRSIEVLLGKTPLFSMMKLKKKKPLHIKIPAQESGELTIRMTNRNYLPIHAGLYVRNLKKEKKLVAKELIDTLFSYDTTMVTKEEIGYYPLAEQSFTLGATLNLTKVPYFIYPIPFEPAKNGKGWIYWLGFNQKNINEFQSLVSEKDPLIDYATEKLHFLPYSEPKGLTCAFVNESNALKLARKEKFTPAPLSFSANRGPNYGKLLESTAKYQQKSLYLACLNTNSVSDQTVYFKGIYLEGKPYTEQVVNKIPTLIKSFKIYAE